MQHESGTFNDVSSESCTRFMTPKEKYQLLLDAACLNTEERGGFLRERGIHSEHLFIWDQELREMIDKKPDPKDQEFKELRKKNKELLEKELQRKEKALAEAPALLILK